MFGKKTKVNFKAKRSKILRSFTKALSDLKGLRSDIVVRNNAIDKERKELDTEELLNSSEMKIIDHSIDQLNNILEPKTSDK